MPELPEVESTAQALRESRPGLSDRRIEEVQVLWPGVLQDVSVHDFERRLLHARFTSVGRHGKYLLLGLRSKEGNDSFLVVHLRMTGRLYLVAASEAIARHTRLAILLDQDMALRFDDPRKFGRVWLVENASAVVSGLGPDALTVSFDDFAARMEACRRQIKPLLLDQSVLAGIGNIYADEILFRAGLHPLTNSGELTREQVRLLYEMIIAVLQEAVAAQGANIDGVFKAGQFVVNVYGRHGSECRICGNRIVKLKVGQRGTHICTHCQGHGKPR
ncbi:DNA-formamidopyrimidine glycosylase [Geobacter sp. SVR]|uniref:DNA-formamidopyrimidine glycosylase n=1 Tax=Geobacter sp. SVR TaxID=2495594 RepID=UPI00143F0173|nr:DNA-formamidopyrimidine glycosylase [Geobacter sp. SVR]BCS53807.1 formamidopyrimidine-DNA glycosylase [Geobacter sp. SVR]GCF85684.1 formamidopyrimidine-DNA glycosylase [Geobacter sp. SVR]